MESIVNWPTFLAHWQQEANFLISLVPIETLNSKERDARFPTALSRPPASLEEIAAATSRLEVVLPTDLVSFYQASNGWYQVGFDEYDLVIPPVRQLKWLHQSERAIYEAAMDYAEPDNIAPAERLLFGRSDVQKVIVLSEPCGSGMYLINLARPIGGLSFESYVIRYHGAPKRFPSFSALMVSERQRCLKGLRSLLD